MMDDARPQAESGNRRKTAPRWWNGLVAWLLRSPFHRVLSNALALIVVRGRRSGRYHTLPVGYVEAPGILYVLVAEFRTKRWWRNLEGGAPVALVLRRHVVDARATVLHRDTDRREFDRAYSLYVAKFRSVRAAASEVLMVRCALA